MFALQLQFISLICNMKGLPVRPSADSFTMKRKQNLSPLDERPKMQQQFNAHPMKQG